MRYRLLSFLTLLLGIALYVLYRPEPMQWTRCVHHMGWGDRLCRLQHWAILVYDPGEFVRCSLPDGCWSASYVLLVHSLTAGASRSTRLLCASFIPLLGSLTELGQAQHLLSGYFDPFDLLCYLLPLIIYTLLLLCSKTYPQPRKRGSS